MLGLSSEDEDNPLVSGSSLPPTSNVSFGTYDGTVISWSRCLQSVRNVESVSDLTPLPSALDHDDIVLNHSWPSQLI
jgi:hypothetical protein